MKGGILGRQTAPWQVWCPRQSLAVYVDNGETHPCCYGDNIDFWWWKALSRCGLVCVFTGLGNYGLNLSHLRYRCRFRPLLSNLFLLFQFNFSILPAARLSFSMRKHARLWVRMLPSIYVGQTSLVMHRDTDTQTHRSSHLLTCAAGDLKYPQTSVTNLSISSDHILKEWQIWQRRSWKATLQSLNIDSGPKAVLSLGVLKEQEKQIISDFNWMIRQARSARCKMCESFPQSLAVTEGYKCIARSQP